MKFLKGLGGMLVGLAEGIMIAAVAVVLVAVVVGTGGVAGAVLATMAAAATSMTTFGVIAAVGVAAVGTALVVPAKNFIGKFTGSHPCDCTLDSASQWKFPHRKVIFNRQKAILRSSYLQCTQGGLLQPFLSPVLAQKAADKFAKNNNEELALHYVQEYRMGLVAGFTGLGDPYGTSFCIGTSVYDQIDAYRDKKKFAKEGAVRYTVARNKIKATGFTAISGVIANLTVGIASDYAENNLAKETKFLQGKFNKDDAANGINVIALKG